MDAPTPTARDVLRDRSVVTFLSSVALVTAGVAAQMTALGLVVFDITGRELDLGLLGLAEFAPAAVLAVVSGSLADRFDRRRLTAIGLSGEALCSVGLIAVVRTRPSTVGLILALVVAFGVARAFATPAVRALTANLVAPPAIPRVVALNSLAWQAGLIVGPVVGGALYAVGPTWPFVFATAASIGGAAAVLTVRLHATARAAASAAAGARDARVGRASARATVRDAVEGLRIIRRAPVLLGAISLDLFAVLFGGAVALLPALAEKRLGVGPVALGWLRAGIGIGASLTTAVLALRSIRRHVGLWMFGSVAVFGMATIGLGLTTDYTIAFASLMILSGADAVSVFIRASIVPLITPDALRGRVLAVENVFIGASNELGAFESGLVGQWLGAAGAVVVGGVATLVVVVVWAAAFPALRRIDRFADIEPIPEPSTARGG